MGNNKRERQAWERIKEDDQIKEKQSFIYIYIYVYQGESLSFGSWLIPLAPRPARDPNRARKPQPSQHDEVASGE